MQKGMAVVAVMGKLLMVAAHLIQTQQDSDASKVGVQASQPMGGARIASGPGPEAGKDVLCSLRLHRPFLTALDQLSFLGLDNF